MKVKRLFEDDEPVNHYFNCDHRFEGKETAPIPVKCPKCNAKKKRAEAVEKGMQINIKEK
jgi:Zn finger protein HypA/HybF involved in hydrogenase expression